LPRRSVADDVKLNLKIINEPDTAVLQSALDSLKSWADSWQLSISIDKCCMLNIGKGTTNTCLSISGNSLPVHASTRDSGITISFGLSPTLHINDIVPKAHRQALAILRTLVSRDVDLLFYLFYSFIQFIRPQHVIV